MRIGLVWGSKKALWLLLITVAVIATALLVLLPIRATNIATDTAGWNSQGCFEKGSVYPSTHFDYHISAHERQNVTLWGSYCGSDASTGKLRSPVFEAPTVLELFLAGYLDKPGLELFLEKEDNHRRISLPLHQQPRETWLKVHWWMAANVRGQRVRLVAIDREATVAGWLGVSNPRRLSRFLLFRLQLKSAVRTIIAYLFQFALFLMPGFAAASILTAKRRLPIPVIHLVIVMIVTGAILGYVSFWAFFFSQDFGTYLSFAVYLISGALLVVPKVSGWPAIKATAKAIAEPFLYTALAGLCYISLYFLFTDPFSPGVEWASDRFFVAVKPGDNVIPLIFADKIYNREPVRPFCCGDWLSSDRPPLQAGIVLLERPLIVNLKPELSYELLSSALQCFWVCGVWCLLTSLGASTLRIRQVLGFLIFSGFLFYNSVYTWPKLLAAAFILFLLSILIELFRANRILTRFETMLGASCLGVLLMAHPGSTFSLPVFAILYMRFRHLLPLRRVALGLLLVAGFYLPWSAYQKFVDPPGNRLLKMHLAGIIPVDARTTWQGIRDSYHTHSWNDIVRYKWSNLVMLAGPKFFDSYGLTDFRGGRIDHAATEESRETQRMFVWNALGLVNAGWLAGLFLIAKRPRVQAAIPYSGWLILAALINMIFWSLVTFGPNETQTAHSSYADILLLSVGLLGFVLTLPRIFYLLLLAWQVFNFFVVWVWALPARIAEPIILQVPMAFLGIGLTVALVWLTVRGRESS